GATGVPARRGVPAALAPGLAHVVGDDPVLALEGVAQARRRELDAGVIGITGSVGKTSTKEAVAQVLRRRFSVHASQGNFNNEIGLPIALLDATEEDERLLLEMGGLPRGGVRHLCGVAETHRRIV